ncbi:hypothetical protein EDC04DRAFT_3091493 [Pisolithus marmoratus]|nr:hypothetical protein EDC04DRAFT_3091493 [Pisolithus marmoratus]
MRTCCSRGTRGSGEGAGERLVSNGRSRTRCVCRTNCEFKHPGSVNQCRPRYPNDPRQLCLASLDTGNQGAHRYIHRNQLFKLKLSQGRRLRNGNYGIRSLFSHRPLGIQPIVGWSPDGPVVAPAPNVAPGTFNRNIMTKCAGNFIHLAVHQQASTLEMSKTLFMPSKAHRPNSINAQKLGDALRITKLNTRATWAEPDQYDRDGHRDPDSPLQILLEPLTTTNPGGYSDICYNQLFGFEALLEPRPPNGNSSIQAPVPNQPDNTIVELARTSTVLQVNVPEGTYVVRIQRIHTGDERNHAHAFPNPPITCSIAPGLAQPDVTHQLDV